MSQRVKHIDLSRSYLPIDPNSLPETMHATQGEDNPEARMPVVPYEGWNFMPSAYGWRSYFGLTARLNVDALETPEKTRELFTYQKSDLTNMLIALCDDGIWTKQGEDAGAWTQQITLVDADDGTTYEWSYCVIENNLYVYRQGEANYWKAPVATGVFAQQAVTGLTMAGQLGLFKAGSRLGFWDSANSVGYSEFDNLTVFTPNVGSGANITTVIALVGKIINILQHGDGFIIYGTKSIVGVRKDVNSSFGWKADAIASTAGIAMRAQVCMGADDRQHFAWTSVGILKIENFSAEFILTELYDFLKESNVPIFLKMLEGRFLAVQVTDSDYVDGRISFYTRTIDPTLVTLQEAYTLVTSIPDFTTESELDDTADLLAALNQEQGHAAVVLAGVVPSDTSSYAQDENYGVYTDYIFLPAIGDSASEIAEAMNFLNLNQLSWDDGTIVINGIDHSIISSVLPLMNNTDFTSSKITDIEGTETVVGEKDLDDREEYDNEKNFMYKVSALWDRYNLFADAWIDEFHRRFPFDWSSAGTATPISNRTTASPHLIPMTAGGYPDFHVLAGVQRVSDIVSFDLRVLKDFSYEHQIDGELVYCSARPETSVQLRGNIYDSSANYTFPVTVTVGVSTGDIADATIKQQLNFNVTNYDDATNTVTCADAQAVITALTEIEEAVLFANSNSALALQSRTVSGTPAFSYMTRKNTIASQASMTTPNELEATHMSGVATGDFGTTLNLVVGPDGTLPAQSNDTVALFAPVTYNTFPHRRASIDECGTAFAAYLNSIAAAPGIHVYSHYEPTTPTTGDLVFTRFLVDGTPQVDGSFPYSEQNGPPEGYSGAGAPYTLEVAQSSSTPVTLTSTGFETECEVFFQKITEDLSDNYCSLTPIVSYSYPESYVTYDAYNEATASDDAVPALSLNADGNPASVDTTGVCALGKEDRTRPTVFAMTAGSDFYPSGFGFTLEGFDYTISFNYEAYTIPGNSFLMQEGAAVPYDLLFAGAYVYDTQLKRWGKLKADYRQLLDFSPINSSAIGVIPFTQFGVKAALLDDEGDIYLFDASPEDSYLKFGKVGNFRFGHTALEEVRADFRRSCTGQLEIETSLDGRSVEVGLTRTYDYAASQISQGVGNTGRWHNIAFKKEFDLSYLEYRAWTHSRR
jgi:hypothetical protein